MKTQNDILSEAEPGDDSEAEPGDDLEDELRPEYDATVLKNGARGKYLAQYRSGTNLVLLDADVAKAYPTADAVNKALRQMMQLQEAA